MGKRRLSSDERRLRILQAAVTTFARRGYAEASMEEIARASDITKPVLYDHFASKDALLVAVLESVRDTLLAEGEKALQTSLSRELQVHAAVEAFLTLAENSPDAVKVLVAVEYGHPEAAKAARAVQSIAAARIAAMLKRSSPDMPDWMLSAGANFVMSGLHAIALWWLDNRTVEKKALVDLIAGIAWKGLSALEIGG
jgi:AcrR family transcriptional regulator